MNCGLGTFTFTWAIGVPGHPPVRPLSPTDFLDEARRLGAKVVQVCDNLPLIDLPKCELTDFRERSEASGIAVEIGTRGIDAGNLRRHLALAAVFGSPFVRVVIDCGSDEPTPDQAIERLRPLLPEFRAAGIALAIENHDRLDARTLARIVEELGPEDVGICLDTVNSLGALESPETVIQILGPYTRSLHVKDFTLERVSHQMGFVVEGCPAGRGRLDLPRLISDLRRLTRHPFNAILETWVTPRPTLDETILRERSWTEEGFAYLLSVSRAVNVTAAT